MKKYNRIIRYTLFYQISIFLFKNRGSSKDRRGKLFMVLVKNSDAGYILYERMDRRVDEHMPEEVFHLLGMQLQRPTQVGEPVRKSERGTAPLLWCLHKKLK